MKINQKQMEQAMKKMGVTQVDIPAVEVIIRTATSELRIANPQVAKVTMMGQESFQINGAVEERALEMTISEDDVETVVSQTNATKEDALAAIKRHDGDLASAIMDLNK